MVFIPGTCAGTGSTLVPGTRSYAICGSRSCKPVWRLTVVSHSNWFPAYALVPPPGVNVSVGVGRTCGPGRGSALSVGMGLGSVSLQGICCCDDADAGDEYCRTWRWRWRRCHAICCGCDVWWCADVCVIGLRGRGVRVLTLAFGQGQNPNSAVPTASATYLSGRSRPGGRGGVNILQ